jgi:hypothetical protein
VGIPKTRYGLKKGIKMAIDTTNMTALEIDLKKVEIEKELQQAQSDLHEIELKELEIAKKIVILQGDRKDYQILASKARQIVRTLNLDIKILTSEFWNAKNR